MNRLRRNFEGIFIPSLCMIIIGIVLLVRPGWAVARGIRLFGVALMAVGIIVVLTRGGHGRMGMFNLGGGFAAFLAGLIIFTRGRSVLNIFPTAAGLFIMVNGLLNLSRSYAQGRAGRDPNWLLTAVLSLVAVGFGLYILVHPFKTVNMVARFVGCLFIYNGVLDMFMQTK